MIIIAGYELVDVTLSRAPASSTAAFTSLSRPTLLIPNVSTALDHGRGQLAKRAVSLRDYAFDSRERRRPSGAAPRAPATRSSATSGRYQSRRSSSCSNRGR